MDRERWEVTLPATPETQLQKETRVFREQIKRIANCNLNKTFELTVAGSNRRNRTLVLLFIIIGIFFTLRTHSLEAWANELSLVFQYMFKPGIPEASPDTPRQFLQFTFGAMMSPQNLRYLPLLILPFMIALRAASLYLADIFEIERPGIAREFIMQVALTGSHNKIRIRNGDVAEADKHSPIYLIGGPGQVLVELDSAALFEKPNGMPHVIGPTVKGRAVLEGFERFRQAIDLRDQYTDQMDIKSRSLDGIPVMAKDVRLLYSVARGDQERSAKNPHPFAEGAIEKLVYGQASRVVMDGPYPSEPPTSWNGTAVGLIRGGLGGFMSNHRLAEYIASIGTPEVEKARNREDEIVKVGKEVLSDGDDPETRDIPEPPNFQSRRIVSTLFSQFTESFTKNAREKGVRLEWIGVGIWRTPSEIVPEKHLEAWRMSRENLGRGSPGALKGLNKEAQLQQILRLVQNVPLARFKQSMGKDHSDMVRELLIAYREQLIEAMELLAKCNKEQPSIVQSAINHIDTLLGWTHWAGAASSQSTKTGTPNKDPASSIPPDEEGLYEYLMLITGHDRDRANRLIEEEQKRAPDANRKEWIKRAIEHFQRDNN